MTFDRHTKTFMQLLEWVDYFARKNPRGRSCTQIRLPTGSALIVERVDPLGPRRVGIKPNLCGTQLTGKCRLMSQNSLLRQTYHGSCLLHLHRIHDLSSQTLCDTVYVAQPSITNRCVKWVYNALNSPAETH